MSPDRFAMNYFAHGRRFVHDPYLLAGTALPDWLNVVDRKVKVRSKHAEAFLDDSDPRQRSLARGVIQHHFDDGWFHNQRAFQELCWQFTVGVRDALPPDDSFRPSFLGHILVELLLDAALIEAEPSLLDAYYDAIEALDPQELAVAVNRMAPRPVERLAELLPLFSRERFLSDYQDDGRLCYRLNQVLSRVGLPRLPAEFTDFLPSARAEVYARAAELLLPDTESEQNTPDPPELNR
jgi:hypothetical protein